jgi:septum formation inhibitor-activating ATPase MinD
MRHADLAVVVANPRCLRSVIRRIIGLLDSTTDKAKRGEPMEIPAVDPLRPTSRSAARCSALKTF